MDSWGIDMIIDIDSRRIVLNNLNLNWGSFSFSRIFMQIYTHLPPPPPQWRGNSQALALRQEYLMLLKASWTLAGSEWLGSVLPCTKTRS